MKLLVFGRTGQVAREIAALADGLTLNVIAVDRKAADLEDPEACAAVIRAADVDAVVNAAAYTNVDGAETDEARATVINGTAPAAMARACATRDLPFLHVSTDYVFDGSGAVPHAPGDPTGPINAYGRSKLAGEIGIRAAGARAVILRTSWVFSAHGSNFVKTMLRLGRDRDALSVVADQIGGPTPAADIAATLVAMAQRMQVGLDGGTYHYGGMPAVSWADFARAVFEEAEKMFGKKVSIYDVYSKDYPTTAARPLNSRLDCATLETDFGIIPPDWRAGLVRVITELETR